MSFDYMKNLSIDFKKGKIKMTVYANNIIPYIYDKWEFDEKNNENGRTLKQEISAITTDILDGNLHPINSCNNYKLWYIEKELRKTTEYQEYHKWRWNFERDEVIEKTPNRKEKIEFYRNKLGEMFIELWTETRNEKYFLYDKDRKHLHLIGAKVTESRRSTRFRHIRPEPKGFYETEFLLDKVNNTNWNSGKYNYGKIEESKIIEESKNYGRAKEIHDRCIDKSTWNWHKENLTDEDKKFIKTLMVYVELENEDFAYERTIETIIDRHGYHIFENYYNYDGQKKDKQPKTITRRKFKLFQNQLRLLSWNTYKIKGMSYGRAGQNNENIYLEIDLEEGKKYENTFSGTESINNIITIVKDNLIKEVA